jgi:hypothetical protein
LASRTYEYHKHGQPDYYHQSFHFRFVGVGVGTTSTFIGPDFSLPFGKYSGWWLVKIFSQMSEDRLVFSTLIVD